MKGAYMNETFRPPVQRLDERYTEQIASLLCEAFEDYPVMRFILGSKDDTYHSRLRRLIHLFVSARFYRNEPVLGIFDGSEIIAGALLSYPDTIKHPPMLLALRNSVWKELGEAAHSRYDTFNAANKPFGIAVPHINVNMIGVSSRYQGKGLGSRLMEEVHRLSIEDSASNGVSLTTEIRKNITFYERLGYGITGYTQVTPELETWAFYRPDMQKED
jgi:GNAT superfamily N-acetyltransferase